MSRKKRSTNPLWDKYRVHFVAAVLVLLTTVTFAGVLSADFTNYDDPSYVTGNRAIRDGITWKGLEYAFFPDNFWHPLTWLSHLVDCQIYGSRPWGHHLTNLILHVATVVLLFFSFRTMTGTLWRSAVIAGLFALHPLHVESVAWVAERKGVLSSFFWMLTLLCYANYAHRLGLRWYLSIFAAVTCALASKPNTITLPFALLLLDIWPLGRWQKGPFAGAVDQIWFPRRSLTWLVIEKLPFFAVAGLLGTIAARAQKSLGAFDMLDVTWYGRVSNALITPWIYLRKFVWPTDLSCFYPHPGNDLPMWDSIVAGAALLLVALCGLLQIRRRPFILTGWLWYLGTLVPVSGIVQIGAHGMADRYTDIPLVGIYWIVAWGLFEFSQRSTRAQYSSVVAMVVALLLFALISTVQTAYWRNATVLFRRALSVQESKLAHYCYAFMLEREKQPEQAIAHFRRAVELDPNDPIMYDMLGNALYGYGRRDEAFAQFQTAVKLDPQCAPALANLGTMLIDRGEVERGAESLRAAIKADPEHAQAHKEYGKYLIGQGNFDGAIAEFQECIRLEPEKGIHHENLSRAIQLKRALPATEAPATGHQP